jgi:hypothetical protein
VQRFKILLPLTVAIIAVAISQAEESAASLDAPHITVSDYQVIPRQAISIDVLEHPPESNPYQLVWTDSSLTVVQVISHTLLVGPDGSRPDIRFTVPSDNLGTYYLQTRQGITVSAQSAAVEVLTPLDAYLPLIRGVQKTVYSCPTTSVNQYVGGTAFQVEGDNPVRPAYNHADKNIALRSYALNPDPNLKRELVDYGAGDPNAPQLATLFSPHRVPDLAAFYQVHNWNWAASPAPGSRGAPITSPPVTALGMGTTPGETLYVPASGYDIGGGKEAIVLFADEDTVTLKYTREDTAATGYTVHIDNICTDPNLLTLYNALDDPNGRRYVYSPSRPYTYDLPILAAGQSVGTARGTEMVVIITDTGTAQDTRSCNEWWQTRPGYAGTCPPGP